MSMAGRVVKTILMALQLLGVVGATQIPVLTPALAPANNAQAPAVPPDPLGRDNPRGTILGFIRAAQEEKYSVAVQYFQPVPRRVRATSGEDTELAEQLLIILNHKFAGPLDFITRDPQGKLDDGLPEDQEKVSGVLGTADEFPIYLVRREDDQGQKLWYFARATLDQVPKIYESLQFPTFEKHIPPMLVEHRWLFVPWWQWIAMLLFIPVCLLIGYVIIYELAQIVRQYRKSRHLPPLPVAPFFRLGPGPFACAILIHYWFVSFIGTSLLYRLYYRRVIWILLTVAFYWLLTRVTRFVSARIGASLASRGMLAERSIVSLLRRFVEVVIFLFVTLFVLHGLGVDVSAALAGVGIGGLALGLGAQKTFENMFGGVSVLFDKVIQIGDPCKINNQVGTVEDIGLRSTRLRTTERTLLTIPNGTMATATIENLRFRDKFLCQQIIRLRYDLSPEHVRFVLGEIRELFFKDPRVEDSSARVQFIRFADYALEVEIYGYILEPDYASYLKSQEELLLKVMDRLEKYGVVVALPTQTTFVTKDSWSDPGKAKTLKAAIEKSKEEKETKPGKPVVGEE